MCSWFPACSDPSGRSRPTRPATLSSKSPPDTHVGRVLCMNLSSLVYVFLLFAVTLDKSKAPLKCPRWSGNCVVCSKKRNWTEGIFCANFYWSLNGFAPCRQMWCGKCYTSSPLVKFHVRPSSAEIGAEGDEFHEGRLAVAWRRHAQSSQAFQRRPFVTSIKEVSLVLKSTIMAAANSETETREETTERRVRTALNKQ